MANNYDKYPNSGTLTKNKRVREGQNDPPYAGQCSIDGKEYWINSWLKQGVGPDGAPYKFFSLSFRAKEPAQGGGGPPTQQRRPAPPKPAPVAAPEDPWADDDVPN